MAINWTEVTAKTGLTGKLEYRKENDGLVRWRGVMTLTNNGAFTGLDAGAYAILPPEVVLPPGIGSYYLDWTGVPTDDNFYVANAVFYIGSFSPIGTVLDVSFVTWYSTPIPAPDHSLINVLTGVKEALENIAGLHVYDFPSSTVQPPAAVLSLPETPYDVTLGGRSDEWTFPLWLLVSKADDKSAYAEMMPYLEAEGDRSIRAMIEADRTLGGACDTCAVLRARPQFATVQGVEFLAVEFTLEVYT